MGQERQGKARHDFKHFVLSKGKEEVAIHGYWEGGVGAGLGGRTGMAHFRAGAWQTCHVVLLTLDFSGDVGAGGTDSGVP